MIFLGTPQHGSNLAAWGQAGINLAKIVKIPNGDIVAVLRPGSETLANIQRDFHSLLRIRTDEGVRITITSFYEELAVPLVGEVKESPLE
jgi:protein SERAC1